MAEYIDRAFKDEEIVLDGNTYRNCSFDNVTFVYGGGELVMDNAQMIRFRWRFTGALANGLHAIYQLFGQQGLLAIVGGFTQPQANQGEVEIDLSQR